MAQHDMNIANQGFPAFRADLNDALAALVSNSSGATAPTTTFAHQFWVDTSANPNVLKQRNADNDAWIVIGSINQTSDTFNLAVAQGGTGAADAAGARTNLGLAIGTDVQAHSANLTTYAATGVNFRNRIINGDMRIDQRNNGASVTPTANTYALDRWFVQVTQASKFSIQQSSTAPTGFNNAALVTSASAYSVLSTDTFNFQQRIEGFNFADLGWGTASAQTITLSFQVRSSLTGTFGGSLRNSAANRSYPFTYTINSANTWETKSVTIAGDTSGTWVGATNGIGVIVTFDLGSGSTFSGTAGAWAAGNLLSATGAVSVVGTNGATFYITGVQLEAGSVATPFERRPYGTELALCQRYFFRNSSPGGISGYAGIGAGTIHPSTTNGRITVTYPTTMRAAPTIISSTLLGYSAGAVNALNASVLTANPGFNSALIDLSLGTVCTVGHGIVVYLGNSTSDHIQYSAEL